MQLNQIYIKFVINIYNLFIIEYYTFKYFTFVCKIKSKRLIVVKKKNIY